MSRMDIHLVVYGSEVSLSAIISPVKGECGKTELKRKSCAQLAVRIAEWLELASFRGVYLLPWGVSDPILWQRTDSGLGLCPNKRAAFEIGVCQ